MFESSAPTCKGNTPEHIQAWYMTFTTFAASKGKCVQPYFCFCSDHVACHRGFYIGDDDDYTQHDLPSRYAPSIDTWSQEIHQAISHKNVFPSGVCDKQITIVNTNAGGHGYKTLLALIQMDHPIYHHHPSSFIRAPPRQCKTKAVSAYFY